MEVRIETEDREIAGILVALKINLLGEHETNWKKALQTLLAFNNPKHAAELLVRRGVPLPRPSFPLYEMKVDGKRKYLPFREAYITFDSGFMDVDTGDFVLEFLNENRFELRPMTKEDEKKISNAADEYSASK